jgi:hypothetical protein
MRRAIAKQSRVRTDGSLRQPTKRCEKDGLCPSFSLYPHKPSGEAARLKAHPDVSRGP